MKLMSDNFSFQTIIADEREKSKKMILGGHRIKRKATSGDIDIHKTLNLLKDL